MSLKSVPGNQAGPPDAYKKVYNLEQIYLKIGEQQGFILANINLPMLDPSTSLDGETILCLSLVTAFQLAELISDPIASELTMTRKDWKAALHLPFKHPGFSTAALCRFREGLKSSSMALQEFEKLLGVLGKMGLYSKETKDLLDPNEAITTICTITRFYHLHQVMKTALSMLVSTDHGWLRANALPHWYHRYKTNRLIPLDYSSSKEMQEVAVRIGKDMQHLLAALRQQNSACVTEQVEMNIARLLNEEFSITDDQIRWHTPDCVTCACNPMRSGGSSFSP